MLRSSLLVVCSFLCLVPVMALGQSTDAQRIEQCRQAVLACQLQDGAIVTVAYREFGRHALVEPYFAHLACSGILAAEQFRPNFQNREFVAKWLKWYAMREKTDDGIFVLDGIRGPDGLANARTMTPDSFDSYAALYLYVAGKHANVTKGKLDPNVVTTCLRMLAVLESCKSPNGLFWNFPPHTKPAGVVPAEYLLDNVEVYQGLKEISAPLAAVGRVNEAKRAVELAATLANKLGEFWSPKDKYYVCMYGDRVAGVAFGEQPLRAEGLATASALSFFDNVPTARRETLWTRFQKMHSQNLAVGYNSLNYPLEDPTIERVYLAALRSAPKSDREIQLTLLRRRVDALLDRNSRLGRSGALADGKPFPYCHRFGLMLIGLVSPVGKPTPFLPTVPLPTVDE